MSLTFDFFTICVALSTSFDPGCTVGGSLLPPFKTFLYKERFLDESERFGSMFF